MKRWLIPLLTLLGLGTTPVKVTPSDSKQFIFVKIPESIMPIDRGTKYEDPLDAALKAQNVGEVSGGGSQLGKADENGKRNIEWVGIDVDLTDFDRGFPILKSQLIRLGVPKGTVLEYTRAGIKHSEPVQAP
jgi:hypothetical protein